MSQTQQLFDTIKKLPYNDPYYMPFDTEGALKSARSSLYRMKDKWERVTNSSISISLAKQTIDEQLFLIATRNPVCFAGFFMREGKLVPAISPLDLAALEAQRDLSGPKAAPEGDCFLNLKTRPDILRMERQMDEDNLNPAQVDYPVEKRRRLLKDIFSSPLESEYIDAVLPEDHEDAPDSVKPAQGTTPLEDNFESERFIPTDALQEANLPLQAQGLPLERRIEVLKGEFPQVAEDDIYSAITPPEKFVFESSKAPKRTSRPEAKQSKYNSAQPTAGLRPTANGRPTT